MLSRSLKPEDGRGFASTAETAPPSGRDLNSLAMRVAKDCRIIIQACLREEEWADAEEEFRLVILAGLKEI
jgi:hypothetical protein